MSKRALKSYLNELTKKQLQEQVLDLYTRFKPVKTYYNFVFNPKEEKLLDDAKFKISKARRSVAQKIIKHYIQLGVDAFVVADVMLFNIEVAQEYCAEKPIKQDSFYTSMFKSFEEVLRFTEQHGIQSDFTIRFSNIVKNTEEKHWVNSEGFRNMISPLTPEGGIE